MHASSFCDEEDLQAFVLFYTVLSEMLLSQILQCQPLLICCTDQRVLSFLCVCLLKYALVNQDDSFTFPTFKINLLKGIYKISTAVCFKIHLVAKLRII